jgi:hypothetical protein
MGCLTEYAKWIKAKKETARASKKCTTCFKRRTYTKATCTRCLRRSSLYSKKARNLAIRAGRCPGCRRPTRQRYYCRRCNEIQADDKVVRALTRLLAKRCVSCGRLAVEGSTRCFRCRRRHRAYNRRRENRTREELLDLYGARCQCCGVRFRQFLTLDHLFNDGHIERRRIRTSYILYRRILTGKASKDRYQLLCYNCNLSKAHYGVCPHQAAPRPRGPALVKAPGRRPGTVA